MKILATFRRTWERMRGYSEFRRLLKRVVDGVRADQIRTLLGKPDLVGAGDAAAGIEFTWEYHDRLPDDVDLVIAFANDQVVFSTLRHVPNETLRNQFRRPRENDGAKG